MTSEPQAPGAPAIILFHQVDRDDNGKRCHEDDYYRFKVLTEEGRKYANIEIPFVKDNVEVVKINARTIRPDGSIVNFDGKIFDKTIVKAKGFQYLAKTFTLPQVEVGSIIEYYYSMDFGEGAFFNLHWILNNELFTKSARFSLKPYDGNYNIYPPMSIRWSWKDLPPGTLPPQDGKDQIIRLEAHDIPAFSVEDFMPPENELKSRVDFIYDRNHYIANVDQFWKLTAQALNEQLGIFLGKPKAMEQAVAQMVAPNDSPEIKLQKIYARVQQLRNLSFEAGKTMQEERRAKEKQAKNIEDVWKRGYGDSTQLTWLYLALVRAAGFEAYGVLASDRSNYFFSPKGMDESKLNARMVLVKLNGKDFYCDPGAAYVPFGLLPWPETEVPGLRLDKDGGAWIKTPAPEGLASRIERTANLKLSEMGDLEGKLAITFTGLEAWQRRVEMRDADEIGRKKFLENEVRQFVSGTSEVELVNKPDWSSSAPILTAEFTLKVLNWASKASSRTLVPVGLFSAPEKYLFQRAERIHPIYFEFPFQRLDDISIALPPDWQPISIPAAHDRDDHYAAFTSKVENNNRTLHITRKISVNFTLLEREYYPLLRAFFQTVRRADEEQIVLQSAGALVSEN